MQATLPQAQVTTVGVTLDLLRDVVADLVMDFPEHQARIERGARLLALYDPRPAEGVPGVYWVRSEEGPEQYIVMQGSTPIYDGCTCCDHKRRYLPCKHSWAVRLAEACYEPPPSPLGLPGRAYDNNDRFELTALGEAALVATRAWVA